MHAGGAPLGFDDVNARLEEADQMLAEAVLSDGCGRRRLHAGIRDGSVWRACGAQTEQQRRAQLKARIKEAERAGNLAEALRLAEDLQKLERRTSVRA